MKMRTRYLSLVVTAVALPSLVLAGQDKGPDNDGAMPLRPSEHSVVVIPDEGGVGCNKFSSNDFVMEMRGRISCANQDIDVYRSEDGPSGSIVDGSVRGGGESADYTYNCSTGELSFDNATVGINAAITGGKKRNGGGEYESSYYDEGEGGGGSSNINRFVYGSARRADSMITNQDPDSGGNLPIKKFSLCFGLPSSTDDQPLPT
ncbi:MAG: hypothetical protein WBM71_02505, partial [Sedimenticolaceae bacterium]